MQPIAISAVIAVSALTERQKGGSIQILTDSTKPNYNIDLKCNQESPVTNQTLKPEKKKNCRLFRLISWPEESRD